MQWVGCGVGKVNGARNHFFRLPTRPPPSLLFLVLDINGTNWALQSSGATASSSSQINCTKAYKNTPTSIEALQCPKTQLLPAINDGSIGTAFASSGSDQAWLSIRLPRPVYVQSVVVTAKQNCPSCMADSLNASVVLLDASDAVVTSTVLTDFGGAGSTFNWVFFGSLFDAGSDSNFNDTNFWNATDTDDGYQPPTTLVFPGFSASGASGCAVCLPGTYSNASGSVACAPCPVGSFSSAYGALSCTACAPGWAAPYAGAAQCDECPLNTMATSTGCFVCPAGTSSELPADANDGVSSPAYGYWNGSARTSCNACGYGKVSTAGGKCTLTPPGSYAPARKNAAPVLCAAGTYSSRAGASYCLPCPPNTVSGPGGDSCKSCLASQYALADQSGCAACGAGSVSTGNSSSCSPCGPGQYSNASLGGGALLYLRTTDLGVGVDGCTTGQPITVWRSAAPLSSTNADPIAFSASALAEDSLRPTRYYDAASGQCVARFNSSCSRLSVADLGLFNAESSIVIMARAVAGGASGRVLSDYGNDWLLGWWNGKQDQWLDRAANFSSSSMVPASNSWSMYTLTRIDSGFSTLYRFGTVLATASTVPGGFNSPVLGGWGGFSDAVNGDQCSDVDIGAVFIYSYALSSDDVQILATALTQQFSAPGTPPTMCAACPGGTSASQSGSSTCTVCSPGTYAPPPLDALAGASNCTACSSGTYSAASGASACTPSLPGTYVSVNDLTQQVGCLPGSYSAGQAAACSVCAAGSFSAANASSCTTCAAGTFSSANSSVCTACTAGYYSAPGATNCTQCAPGYVSKTGSAACTGCTAGSFAGVSSCSLCTSGFYSGSFATACSICPAGTTSVPGSAACAPCPVGQFSAPGSTVCTACLNGTFAANSSVTSCAPCPIGTALTGGAAAWACTPCPDGTAANATGFSSCTSCIGGGNYASASSSGSAGCLSCASGSAGNLGWSNSCGTQCTAPGTYPLNATFCASCPIGSFSVGSAKACSVCPFGTTTTAVRSSTCSGTQAGYYLPAGTTVARQCPAANTSSIFGSSCYSKSPGTFSAANAPSCTTCAMGTVALSVGSKSCTSCTSSCATTYSPSTLSCYLAFVLDGSGSLQTNVSTMWGGADWSTNLSNGWSQYAPAYAGTLPFTLPAACAGRGAVNVTAGYAAPDGSAASFVFSLPYSSTCTVGLFVTPPSNSRASFSTNVVSALAVTYEGLSVSSWQVFGPAKGSQGIGENTNSTLVLLNALPFVNTLADGTVNFAYTGTTSSLGFPAGTPASVNYDPPGGANPGSMFYVAPQGPSLDTSSIINSLLSTAGSSGSSGAGATVSKFIKNGLNLMLGSAGGSFSIPSPSGFVYLPITTYSLAPVVVGSYSGTYSYLGNTYSAQIWGGLLPPSLDAGSSLSAPITVPFVLASILTPQFDSWGGMFSILALPKVAGIKPATIIQASLSWLPMGTTDMRLYFCYPNVAFRTLPDAAGLGFAGSGLPGLTSGIPSGLYAQINVARPTSCDAADGILSKAVCAGVLKIMNNPAIANSVQDSSLTMTVAITPAYQPAVPFLTFAIGINDIKLSNKLTLTGVYISVSVGWDGSPTYQLTFEVDIMAAKEPITLWGYFSITLNINGEISWIMYGQSAGYILNAFGSPRSVLHDIAVGPLIATMLPSGEVSVTYMQFQAGLIMYSRFAQGNPADPKDETLIDYCAAGGTDALNHDCLSLEVAFGGGESDVLFGLSTPDFWFYASLDDVVITGRSLVCIVANHCVTPTSPMGTLLDTAVVYTFTASSSLFQRVLVSGINVPAGINVLFNATLFGIASAAVNITSNCIGPVCYYTKIDAYTTIEAGKSNGTQLSASLKFSAYESIFHPLDTYSYFSLTMGVKKLKLSELVCKFGAVCYPELGLIDNLFTNIQADVNGSFTLKPQTIQLLDGTSVDLPRGFRASMSLSLSGYPVRITASADKTGKYAFALSIDGQYGAYKSGHFILCATKTNCSLGPSFHTGVLWKGTSFVGFNTNSTGYIKIFGVTAYYASSISVLTASFVTTVNASSTFDLGECVAGGDGVRGQSVRCF